jgi:hypothetical protein
MITNPHIGNYGRLGNQMFQLATLIGIAKKNGTEVVIPNDQTGHLTDFSTGQGISYGLELPSLFELHGVRQVPSNELTIERYYNERSFTFDEKIFDEPDNTAFVGYFQSEKYFKHARHEVLSAFWFKQDVVEEASNEIDKINPDPNKEIVAIHVRRGDYLGNQGNHCVLPIEYYDDTIQTFFYDKEYDFWIFSDDPDWCAENFDGGTIINTQNPYVDLCLMSMCNHNVIANSSFSWWGAWLNPRHSKIVVAPSLWFGPYLAGIHSTIDLIPESWFVL